MTERKKLRLDELKEVKGKVKSEQDKIKGICEIRVKPQDDIYSYEHRQKLLKQKEMLDKKVKAQKDYAEVIRKEKAPKLTEEQRTKLEKKMAEEKKKDKSFFGLKQGHIEPIYNDSRTIGVGVQKHFPDIHKPKS